MIYNLDVDGLEKLSSGIESYLQIERKNNGPYLVFWTSLRDVCNAEKRSRNIRSTGVHKMVLDEVNGLFKKKTTSELKHLLEDIQRNIRTGKSNDVEYWGEMENQVGVQLHKSIVHDIYRDILKKRTEVLLTLKDDITAARRKQELKGRSEESQEQDSNADYRFLSSSGGEGGGGGVSGMNGTFDRDSESRTSLKRMTAIDDESAMEESEERMSARDEVQIATTYAWEDKYRPRKPRYFNRVKTGFDWNKYNSTHYDKDNPPPKSVQGYKFNIFFPDLIDNSVTPRYFLEAANEKEFAIVRFHAGPPYEDIAFKIVNQEWDINTRSGFKCVFERGVLQLNFNFKRHWYRR